MGLPVRYSHLLLRIGVAGKYLIPIVHGLLFYVGRSIHLLTSFQSMFALAWSLQYIFIFLPFFLLSPFSSGNFAEILVN